MDGNERIAVETGYLALFSFLEDYYQRTQSDEIASLLSGMMIGEDGFPLDPAYWSEWVRAVEKARRGQVDAKLSFSDESNG